jgi:hypothetical protein
MIEISRLSDFFSDSISVRFDYVRDIVRRYDNDVIFNKIDIGYQKWQSEDISGIDDAQTKHSYATRFKKVGKAISLVSGFIAASLAIETTRRFVTKKSADYKYDNETFIIAVDDLDSTPGMITPETNENYTFITGLKNPSYRYNSRITPARNLIRWMKYLNGCLQSYIGSIYKFVSGEGNFDMDSDLDNGDCDDFSEAVSEKQDLPVGTDYIHLPEIFEINIPMSWDQYKAIRNNRKKAIGISQTNAGHTAFFIKNLEFEICKSKAKITAWPKTRFQIVNTDFVIPDPVCVQTVFEQCGDDDRFTEDFEYRLTEDGECREIE